MAKVKHYVLKGRDGSSHRVIRETKRKNKVVEYEEVSQDQLDNHEALQGIITGISAIIAFVLVCKYIIF